MFASWNHADLASGLTSLLAEKILLAKLCKWIKKLTSRPETMPNLQNFLEHSDPADLLHRGLQGLCWKLGACAL